MKTQKIIINVINRYSFPVTAGIETVILETFSRLVKKSYDVTFHVSRNTLTAWNILPNSEIIKGISVKRYQYSRFGFFPQVNWKKTDMVFLMNFDMFPHLFILSYCLLLKITGKKKFKLVLAPHGGYTPAWETFSPIARIIKSTYHKTLGKFLINNTVDVIHAVSEWEKNEILSYGIKNVPMFVLGNGLEETALEDPTKKSSQEIKEKIKTFGNYIVQLGRIDPVKNQKLIIQAMPYVSEKIKFVIVGPEMSTAYMNELQTLVKKINLENRVIFAGTIKGYDKYFLLRKAKLMVHMALWENHPISVLEGASQGLYAIVGDNSGLRYAVIPNETGTKIKTNDPKTVAAQINKLYKHTPVVNFKKLRKTGHLQTWDNVVDHLISIIQAQFSYADNKNTNIYDFDKRITITN